MNLYWNAYDNSVRLVLFFPFYSWEIEGQDLRSYIKSSSRVSDGAVIPSEFCVTPKPVPFTLPLLI